VNRPYKNRDWLYQKYIVQKVSIYRIAKICRVSECAVNWWMKKYNIKIRSLTEAWQFRPPCSLETRKKRSKAMLGFKHSEETKRKIGSKHKGKIISEEQREKISNAMKGKMIGRKNPMFGKNHTEEIRNKITGKLKEWHKKNPDIQKGENNHQWKGGTSTFRMMIRRSKEYKNWRKSVFKRDHYACVKCEIKSKGNLEAHHILPWSLYPNERFNIDNGMTLCIDCHGAIT